VVCKMMITGENRTFLLLQGPHGPFFWQLALMLRKSGAKVHRVGFNAGDQAFWHDKRCFTAFKGEPTAWPDTFRNLIETHTVTDLVLYGDVRPIHAKAIAIAKELGITVHVFEEGYLRPYWVTYERDGSNGHSRLMDLSVEDMQQALAHSDLDVPTPPASWGDMREHIFYGAVYHWFVWTRGFRYPNFARHRKQSVAQEFGLYLRRLMLLPIHSLERILETARIRRGGFPYHLVLLQLSHDANFQAHSEFADMESFLDVVLKGFADGAPPHHHLVFKAHPLENGAVPLRRIIQRIAKAHGIADRVHYVRGGKLAGLLSETRTAVTVNSTAAQQVLWRGIPLKVFGRAVYSKPQFASRQALAAFFSTPERPDAKAYKDYRRFLLETSQVPGGFYSSKGRRQVMRHVVDMMLHTHDPYDALLKGTAAPRQQLQLVRD